jgi:arylsulfatase A-like enzyme
MSSTHLQHESHHLTVALRLAALAWLAMALQELLLFARPNPYGESYVEFWWSYLAYALVYNLLGVMLVSAPAILFWLVWNGRQLRPRLAENIHRLQLGLLIVTVVLDHLDNEVMRFMGIHLTYELVRTYFRVNAWGRDMFQILLEDRGGPGLPFLILFLVPLALWWAGRRVIRSKPLPLSLPRSVELAVSLMPVLLVAAIQEYRFPGEGRKDRVQPEIITLYDDLRAHAAEGGRPHAFDALAREYHAVWFQQSGDTAWRFTDPERPLIRVPLTPPAPIEGRPWNVIFIQLETFRGWNTGFLRPDVTPSATPFLDSLARDSASAFWRRHLSFGPPTVSGFMAAHCSVKPHSRDNITASFTYTALDCLPEVLRRHGYRAELFTGFDPDWDNQGIWMRKWYDAYHYYDDIKNQDRLVFRRAGARIRELGRGPQPFMATVISISNHIPFLARRMGPSEERFDLDPEHPPRVAIRNTMRYTDDVVRELIESLEPEPWFARTLIVITGDHGFNLGEHGTSGVSSGWREAVWVPLVIHGAHPRLPRGGHDEPATLLDIPPTVADLLGIREPTAWMGSSLVVKGHTGSPFASTRKSGTFGEQGRFSLAVDPATGRPGLYDAVDDPLERKDIASLHPDVVADLRRQAQHERVLVDYLLEADLVWRPPGGQRADGRTD